MFGYTGGVGYELARALLLAEIVTPQALEKALYASLREGTTLPRALLDTKAIDTATLEDMLSRVDAPLVRTVMPLMDLMSRLPPGMCTRLLAVPIRRDPTTGVVDVAVADAREPHTKAEIEHHLQAPVRMVRATIAAIEEGLTRKSRTMPPAASVRGSALPAPYGGYGSSYPVAPGSYTAAYDRPANPSTHAAHAGASQSQRVPPVQYSAPVPPREEPPSRYGAGGVIAAVVPERRQIPVAATHAGSPTYSQEPPRRTSMTPPWGTAVPSVRAPESRAQQHSVPSARPPLFAQSEVGTHEYGTVPEPEDTRPAELVPTSNTQVPPSLAGHSPTTTAAIERPIPLTRMSVNAPRERPSTLHFERHPTQLPHTAYDAEPMPSFIPGPPPRTARGPYNAQAGFPFADGSSVLAALRSAEDRDHVLELLLVGARAVARKVGIFVVKRGGLVGWTCTPEFGERVQLQALTMSLTTPSIFTTAMSEGLYLGAVRHDDVHAQLLRVMGGASRDVAVAPVRVLGKAAVVVIADDLGDTMIATRRLEELARAAGEAFARIMKSKAR